MGLAGMGSVFMLGANPAKAFGQSPLLASLSAVETDRILVLTLLVIVADPQSL